MTISTSAIQTPISKPNQLVPVIDMATGCLTDYGVQLLSQYYNFVVGMNRIIPCNASGTNDITLTTLDATPLVSQYSDHDVFAFVASATSNGSVTMHVVTRGDALGTIKAYKTNGSAQAGSGDIVSGSLYFAVFNDALDSGNGGLVIK